MFAALVDFGVAFSLVGIALVLYRVPLTWNLLSLPAFVLLTLALAQGVGFWLAALNVEYRDIRYIVPFMTQLWMFATPIAYPSICFPRSGDSYTD